MTNEEFMQRAQLQKANADYMRHYAQRQKELHVYLQRQKVNDWFIAAFIWLGLIVAVPVLLVLLVFAFTADYTMTPETVIAFLLVCILFNMGRK